VDDRHDIDALLVHLEAGGSRIKGRSCACPWHEDKTPSASIIHGDDGVWRVFCHVCQRRADVLDLRAEASGRPVAELLREATESGSGRPAPAPARQHAQDDLILADKQAVADYAKRLGKVEAWHRYGPNDDPVLVVARVRTPDGKKTFRQFSRVPSGWVPRNTIERGCLPLYRQQDLADGPVLVAEGERCVDACWSIGVQAVTSAMGAGKAGLSDWSALRGRQVVIWPDHDAPGASHAAGIATMLEGLGCTVSIIDPAGLDLGKGGDVVDLLDRLDSRTPAELAQVVRDIMGGAETKDPAGELVAWHNEVIAGKWADLSWPLPRAGKLARACLPGNLVVLCADPGAGKSFLALQLAAHWQAAGHQVAVRMLEDDRRTHLARLLAQLDGEAGHTDDAWVRLNPEAARAGLAQHRATLNALGAVITAEAEAPASLDEIAAWVEAAAAKGARVVIVDPVTAAATSDKPWAADFTAAMRLKRVARQTGCTVIVTTHPRGGKSAGPGLGGMAGGSAWPRFAHSVLWLERFTPAERRTNDGDPVTCNRSLQIVKSRHGKGSGMNIGLVFEETTVRFREVGVLAPEDAQRPARVPVPKPPPEGRPSRGTRLRQDPASAEDLFT
jgi:hypothetical protein